MYAWTLIGAVDVRSRDECRAAMVLVFSARRQHPVVGAMICVGLRVRERKAELRPNLSSIHYFSAHFSESIIYSHFSTHAWVTTAEGS